jgi:hypothetical protein
MDQLFDLLQFFFAPAFNGICLSKEEQNKDKWQDINVHKVKSHSYHVKWPIHILLHCLDDPMVDKKAITFWRSYLECC